MVPWYNYSSTILTACGYKFLKLFGLNKENARPPPSPSKGGPPGVLFIQTNYLALKKSATSITTTKPTSTITLQQIRTTTKATSTIDQAGCIRKYIFLRAKNRVATRFNLLMPYYTQLLLLFCFLLFTS